MNDVDDVMKSSVASGNTDKLSRAALTTLLQQFVLIIFGSLPSLT